MSWLRRIPHLFAKSVIWVCLAASLAFGGYGLWGYFRTGLDPSRSLTVILGVLGGELLLSCLRTVLRERGKQETVSKSDTAEGGNDETI